MKRVPAIRNLAMRMPNVNMAMVRRAIDAFAHSIWKKTSAVKVSDPNIGHDDKCIPSLQPYTKSLGQ